MTARLLDGRFADFRSGAVEFDRGFVLSGSDGVIDASRFSIVTLEGAGNRLGVRLGSGAEAYVAFELEHPRGIFDADEDRLTLAQMDLVLSEAASRRIKRPELAGKVFGGMNLVATTKVTDAGGRIEPAGQTPLSAGSAAPIDVAIVQVQTLQAVGRVGTYPNGRNGLSMSTTACNVGSDNIPWYAPMNVNHPVIAMNLYRVRNNRFEHVGWSWLKHGFFATNSSGCGTCQNPGTGSLLGPNCSDTYGVFNNADRNYLGGRDEVNPFTGVWTCQNSYFSNYVNDCVRRNNGSGLDAVAHRLEVLDADLGNANSTYYFEAYYINAGDFDVYNNIAHRSISGSWNGSSWSFPTQNQGPFTQGPAINRWGDMRTTASPQDQGDVIVAVQTTDLGGGKWHYEYAVYNHNLDRQIREFKVPAPASATIENIEFRDIDQNATNQWASSYENGHLVWRTGEFGAAGANPLKYSSVFNFRFDANVPPASSTVALTLFKPGSGTALTAATKGPLVFDKMTSFQPVNGSVFIGDLGSLEDSDNDRLIIRPGSDGYRFGTGITARITAPQGTINSFMVGLEFSNSLQASANARQITQLMNWQTGNWETIDTRSTTQSDQKATLTVNSNAARFVNATTRAVDIRLIHESDLGVTTNRWELALDQVGFHFN